MTASSPQWGISALSGPDGCAVFVLSDAQCIVSHCLLRCFPIIPQKMRKCPTPDDCGEKAAQIYKFFMTIPMLLDLFHIQIYPSGSVFSTVKVRPFSVLVFLSVVHVTSAVIS